MAVSAEFAFQNALTVRIAEFLVEIGLEVRAFRIEGNTVLPGVQIADGAIVIDESRLSYPGDLLHEAGHLAVTPGNQRKQLEGDVSQGPAEEMMAIAWSYAAAVHLGLDPSVVFHTGGYRGGSESILENFREGRYIGLPMLQWIGLTADGKQAKEKGVAPYPAMLKWLRD